MNNTSFTDIPRNTAPLKSSPIENRQKLRFRKTALVSTAVQNKKINKNNLISDNSDSDDSIQSTKKNKKKIKPTKSKFTKGMSETKSKN